MQISTENIQEPREHTPEQRLWVRVLKEAIQAAAGKGIELDPRDVANARRWIAREHKGNFPMASFSWVCQELGLDEHWIRDKTLEATDMVAGCRRTF